MTELRQEYLSLLQRCGASEEEFKYEEFLRDYGLTGVQVWLSENR